MKAFVPGIYPRSEALVQATRDLDRGRTSAEAVDEQLARDREQLVAAQQAAGLSLLSDGMLAWQDLFRPLVEASAGLQPGALTRFLDTNTFFRAPEADGEPPLGLAAPLDGRYISPVPGPRLVTLPSPYALGHGTGLTPRVLAERVLRPQLVAPDTELVVLAEPFLAREPSPDLDALGEALEALAGGPPLALQLVFGNAGPLLDRLAGSPVEAVGVDFYATHLDDVPEGFPKTVLAGVVDARSSIVEDAGELRAFADRLEERIGGEVALVPNGDLQFVSEPVAREKLARLGEAT